MRVKVDEDLPREIVSILRAAGHEADGVRDEGLGGWSDASLWQLIQREPRFLVTADKGFASTRSYPLGTHAGILLLRPPEDGIRPLILLLGEVLDTCKLETLSGAVAVASHRGIGIRRPGSAETK